MNPYVYDFPYDVFSQTPCDVFCDLSKGVVLTEAFLIRFPLHMLPFEMLMWCLSFVYRIY